MTADGDEGLLIAAWLAHERVACYALGLSKGYCPPMLDAKRQRHKVLYKQY